MNNRFFMSFGTDGQVRPPATDVSVWHQLPIHLTNPDTDPELLYTLNTQPMFLFVRAIRKA